MIFLMGSITHASDNRSAPNVFSSGSTISSSQMNENFNFLASEIREKEVNCNNGETISDAINEGYNSLTIYGTCDGGVMVYMFDPNPFGVTYSQMSNKPISHLIIKGGDSNRTSKIINTTGGMGSMVTSKGYLQLYNLTFNDKIGVNDGGMLDATKITYEVTVTGKDNRIGAYGNSQLTIHESTINAEIGISESSLGIIKETIINIPTGGNEALYVSEVSHLELEDNSQVNGRISVYEKSNIDIDEVTINCNALDSCIDVNNSSIEFDDVTMTTTSVNYSVLNIYAGSKASIRNSTITADGNSELLSVRGNSIIELHDSTVTSGDGRAIYLSNNSNMDAYNATITRTTNTPTMAIDKFSSFQISGSTSISDIYCYDPYVKIENYENISFTKNNTCDGYKNFAPEYRSINSGTCESNGYKKLISHHECAQATNTIRIEAENNGEVPVGCFRKTSGLVMFNTYFSGINAEENTIVNEIWCKE